MAEETVTVTTTLAAAVLGVLAVVAGYVLGWANRAFHVEVDAKVEAILKALPGANCGACGFLGCAEYAEAVAKREAEVNLCIPGGVRCAQSLATIMGVEVSETYPYRAVVHCAAREDQRLQRIEHHGEPTCAAANLVAYVQACTYGCLGLGDCVRACKYDAIHVIRGLARVDYDKCIGCGACMRACPRNIITMVPFKADHMLVVACSNQDSGPDVKAVCTIGCLGCKVCTRNNNLIEMDGNLPRIDYGKYDPQVNFEPVIQECPRESLVFVGEPGKRQLTTVPGEGLPECAKADLPITVHDTNQLRLTRWP